MPEWAIALLGVVVGAIVTGAVEHVRWKIEYQEELKSSEQQARRQKESQLAERLVETCGQLIEMGRLPIFGSKLDPSVIQTANSMELSRLRRELANVAIACRQTFPHLSRELTILERMVLGLDKPGSRSPDDLRAELDAIGAKLRQQLTRTDE